MTPSSPAPSHPIPPETLGLWLGLLGVLIFSLTLPMTRLAVGPTGAPQLSGVFVAMGRAAVAGVLSLAFLALTRARRPTIRQWKLIALSALGSVFGFPIFTSVALRHVESVHASVILGLLPLGTAVAGAWLHRQRPSAGFWLCAAGGSALVIGFALLRSGGQGLQIHWADALLLAAMGWGAMAYVSGARLAEGMRADHAICWALVLSLPFTVPAALLSFPAQPVATTSWLGFAYVSLFSMWIGFFAWYRGLVLGGTVRVSQVQLVQPFLSMVFSGVLLGEILDSVTVGFGLAVVAVVFIGRKMSVGTPPKTS